MIALLAVWAFFESAYEPGAIVLLTLVMTLVACGADLFGLLTRPTSFFLGEAAYSLYLLHPLMLSVAFKVLLPRWAGTWTAPLLYWSVILVITPLLVWFATMTFRWIERPGIDAGRRVDAWMLRRKAKGSLSVGKAGAGQPRPS